jgi:hypothetical protein
LLKYTEFTFNGQEAIDKAKIELEQAIMNQTDKQKIKPVSLMLLDF